MMKRICQPSKVATRKSTSLLGCPVLIILLVVVHTNLTATLTRASADDTKRQQTFVDFFDLPDMPLRIDDATLSKIDGGYVLKCSAVNRSDEQLFGLGLVMLIFDSSGQPRGGVGLMQRAPLASYASKEFSFELPLKLKVKADDHVALIVEQVIGRETIWRVLKAEDALKAYLTTGQYVIPEVKQVSNQFDGVRLPLDMPGKP